MRPSNERWRSSLAVAAVLTVVLAGCEAENPLVVKVPAGQARVVVTFPGSAAKAEGDFDLDLTLRVHGEGRLETELNRTIEVRGWVAQGTLEVPSQAMIMVDARATLEGVPHAGFGQIMPLEPGTSTTLFMEMFPEQ